MELTAQTLWSKLETHFFHMNSALHVKRTTADLTQLIDTLRESIRALEDVQRPTVYCDDWFVYLTVSKLDKTTREDWEKSIENDDEFPVFDSDCTRFWVTSSLSY